MKYCSFCKKNLNELDFYVRKTGKRAGQIYEKCKNCMKVRGRYYYANNHDRQLTLAIKRRHKAYLEKRSYLNKVKDKPCMDCGTKYPFYVMDFDHKKGERKINDVAYMVTRNWSLQKIKEEIIKCDVVCANCHRIRTYKPR